MSAHAVLTAEAHGDLRIRTERGASYGDAVMSCLVVPDEFRRVQEEYPILFRLGVERDSFTALALFGFEAGENLFLDGERWDARMRPLAMEIQPFLIGGAEASATKQVHIDMASPRIDHGTGDGIRLFDEHRAPTPYLERVADQLGELDAGYHGSHDFFAALRRHDLLEPLMLDATLEDGSSNRLVGFHAIDEERLAGLDAGVLGELHEAGYLLPIYMAVASLGRIGALVERRNRRLRRG